MKVINDLFDYKNYKIVQDNNAFKFSLDSILLAEFVNNVKPSDLILDVCTGNAVGPLILTNYYKNKIVAFEIQKDIANIALESVKLNKKEKQIKIINDNIKVINNYFPGNNFNIIIANPPYFKYQESSLINEKESKAIARHEIKLNLEELFQVVKKSLKENGVFYLVHLPERIEEILFLAEKYKICAKELQFVYTKENKDATIVLIKFVNNSNNFLKVKPPLFIYEYKSYQNIFRG